MYRNSFFWLVALGLLLGLGRLAPAQTKEERKTQQVEDDYRRSLLKRAQEEYRNFYKKPETAAEYWAAINFELDVGRFSLAAELIKGLVAATKDADKELLAIEETPGVGLAAFLRFRNLATWVEEPTPLSDDPKIDKAVRDNFNKEARANVETLIDRVTGALKAHLADPARFAKLIQTLSGEPQEYRYAIGELRRSGAQAVPFLVAGVQNAIDNDTRERLLSALVRLGKEAVPPLLASLEIQDPALQLELIDVLKRRAETTSAPTLWYLSAAPGVADTVHQKARQTLAYFREVKEDKLPPPREELTREAQRYYRGQVGFPNSYTGVAWQGDKRQVVLWKVEKKEIKPVEATDSLAEETLGLKFARWALVLDPGWEPAQVVFLSLALEKGFERSGLDQPLVKGAPEVRELLKVVNPELLLVVLERGLAERRLSVILGTVRTLGDLGEVRAARASGRGAPLLVRALNYPDRRVQLAAVEALLRIPGPLPAGVGLRLVEVLRRNLTAGKASTIMIADGEPNRANEVARVVRQLGFQTAVAHSPKEVMQRIAQSADIDALLVDHVLIDPKYTNLLADLRADVDAGLLPLLVTVPPTLSPRVASEEAQGLRRLVERYPHAWVVPLTLDAEKLKATLSAKMTAALGKPLSAEERQASTGQTMLWLKRMARGEQPGFDVRPAAVAITDALAVDELAPLALEATSSLPGRDAQRKLTNVVLDQNRKVEIRAAAALELVRHLQQFGVLLPREQIVALVNLYQAPAEDARLRGNVALVVGSMKPNAKTTGMRLEGYFPPAGQKK